MCPKLDTICLTNRVELNGIEYYLYMGYLGASDILKIAKVPSFGEAKSNVEIARGIPPHNDPVVDWQRPVIRDKIEKISEIYSSSTDNNLMPNPIIISTNPLLSSDPDVDVEILPFHAQTGQVQTQVSVLNKVQFTYSNNKQPLWLLDGQHRTIGMKETAKHTASGGTDRSNDPLPFILLHGDSYDPSQLAKIFTHVTSGATAMDSIHKDWMHYSFKLPKYDLKHNEMAMEAVTFLCIESHFGDPTSGGKISNPFYDKIRFNPKLDSTGFYSFEFDSPHWSTQISKLYYKGTSNPLNPKDLAAQISFSIQAFHDLDDRRGTAAGGSVLFDNSQKRLSRLADAYLCATLTYLRHTCISGMNFGDWNNHLNDPIRDFGNNDWSMPWVGGLDGAPGNASRTLAEKVFVKYLTSDNLIGHKITEYLKGSGASFQLTSVYWDDSKGKKIENTSHSTKVSPTISLAAANLSFTLGSGSENREGLRIEVGPDVQNIDIVDIFDVELTPSKKLPAMKQKKSMSVKELLTREPPGKENSFKITVRTRAFSSSTEIDTTIMIHRK